MHLLVCPPVPPAMYFCLIFQFWEQEKVLGTKSGKYSDYGMITVLFLTKKSRTSKDG